MSVTHTEVVQLCGDVLSMNHFLTLMWPFSLTRGLKLKLRTTFEGIKKPKGLVVYIARMSNVEEPPIIIFCERRIWKNFRVNFGDLKFEEKQCSGTI